MINRTDLGEFSVSNDSGYAHGTWTATMYLTSTTTTVVAGLKSSRGLSIPSTFGMSAEGLVIAGHLLLSKGSWAVMHGHDSDGRLVSVIAVQMDA